MGMKFEGLYFIGIVNSFYVFTSQQYYLGFRNKEVNRKLATAKSFQ